MTVMTSPLQDAKVFVQSLLDMANGDADAVYRSLTKSERDSRQRAGYTEADSEQYALYLLALADLTGHAAYRQ